MQLRSALGHPLSRLRWLNFAAIFTLVFWTSLADLGYCQDETKTSYQKSDLPTGGTFLSSPNDKSDVYYFANSLQMWSDKSNTQKRSGLYHSSDNGKTWTLMCSFFQFKQLFIQPGTGKIFAAIQDTWLESHQGFLVSVSADKIISSSDGHYWRDLTGKQKHFGQMEEIFQDPDNPDRICVRTCMLREVVLQSTDAQYSDWNLIFGGGWEQMHPPAK